VGALIPDVKQQILIVADIGREQEIVTRLARVGYDYAIGYLEGGFEAWTKAGKEVDTVRVVDSETLAQELKKNSEASVLDVRKVSEYNSEHVSGFENVPLDFINENMPSLDKNRTYFVHCAGGYRSMIFISILKARGYDNLVDVKDGYKAIRNSGKFTVTDYVAPITQL
jgi:rhodanese-related sulfurtransferase